MFPLLIALLSSVAFSLANPFGPFLVPKSGTEKMHSLTPPYRYPFEQDGSLDALELDLAALSSSLAGAKLEALKKIYAERPYDEKLNVYAWPFKVGKTWEILPYPIVGDASGEEPAEWIGQFTERPAALQSYDFVKMVDRFTQSDSHAGNSLELLKTPDSFSKIVEKVKASRNHIFLSTYMFHCDAGSEELLKSFEDRLGQGVRIFIILDRLFTKIDPGCVRRLRGMGVRVLKHGSAGTFFHEKMAVFDGEYAMVDGQNILAAQSMSNGHNNLINDMAIGVRGPMVNVIGRRFIHHWQKLLDQEMPEDLVRFYEIQQERMKHFASEEAVKKGLEERKGVCRLVTQDPKTKLPSILRMYLEYLKKTEKYLFFNLIDVLYEDHNGGAPAEIFLSEAVRRANENPGLRVDLLTNNWKRPTDVILGSSIGVRKNLFTRVLLFGLNFYGQRPHKQMRGTRKSLAKVLEEGNFNWWSYAQYMHAKTLMMDNTAVFIGSYNINKTSEKDSYEQVMVCHDEELARAMQSSILLDLLNSIPIPIGE